MVFGRQIVCFEDNNGVWRYNYGVCEADGGVWGSVWRLVLEGKPPSLCTKECYPNPGTNPWIATKKCYPKKLLRHCNSLCSN